MSPTIPLTIRHLSYVFVISIHVQIEKKTMTYEYLKKHDNMLLLNIKYSIYCHVTECYCIPVNFHCPLISLFFIFQ